jgi:hypothetical protein
MAKELTIASILCNAFNQDYTLAQAVDDLSKMVNEATWLQIQGETDTPRFAELERIIPVQERLAKGKIDGHPIFNRLGSLKVKTHKDD